MPRRHRAASLREHRQARERLTALAVATLGARLAERARAETAWPALHRRAAPRRERRLRPRRRAHPVATARELRTARSVSEVLAWRINRHLAATPARRPRAAHPDRIAGAAPRQFPGPVPPRRSPCSRGDFTGCPGSPPGPETARPRR